MKKNIVMLVLVLVLVLGTFTFADNNVPSEWATEFVTNVQEQDILNESFFNNYQNAITRKDFAYLGVRLYEEYTGESANAGESTFDDTTDEWILKAKNIGVVGGYPDGTYKPNNNITREELAVLFVNVFKASNIEYILPNEEKFTDDSEISDWAKESVYIAKTNGIINGIGNNTFSPNGTATKEQSLIMFNKGQKSDSLIVKESVIEKPETVNVQEGLSELIEFSNEAIVNVGGEGYLILDSKLPKELKNAKFSADFDAEYMFSLANLDDLPACFFHSIEEGRNNIGFQITTLTNDDTYIFLEDINHKLLGYTYFKDGLGKSNNIYKVEIYYMPDGIEYIPNMNRYKDFNVLVDFPDGVRNASANSIVGETYNSNGFKSIVYPVYSPYGVEGISVDNITKQKIKLEKVKVLPY